MARADLLKLLLGAYCESFLDIARSIADEEGKKHQPALAKELLRRGIRPTQRRLLMGGAFSG